MLFVLLSASRLGAQGSTPPYLADTLPPYFDIKAYCAGVGDGSNGLELTCRRKERAAEDSIIQRGHTPARIMRDCSRIAADREQADVGSYSLLYTCIKNEEAARRRPP
jgi:hypothetical protein